LERPEYSQTSLQPQTLPAPNSGSKPEPTRRVQTQVKSKGITQKPRPRRRSRQSAALSGLAEYLLKEHRVRSAALGASEVKALAKRVVTEARKLGVEQGRTIARLATAALLVDTDILSRPEVKSLFAFSGIDADLKADL